MAKTKKTEVAEATVETTEVVNEITMDNVIDAYNEQLGKDIQGANDTMMAALTFAGTNMFDKGFAAGVTMVLSAIFRSDDETDLATRLAMGAVAKQLLESEGGYRGYEHIWKVYADFLDDTLAAIKAAQEEEAEPSEEAAE